MIASSKGQGFMTLIMIVAFIGLLVLITVFAGSNYMMREVNFMVQDGDSFDNESQRVMQEATDVNNIVFDNAFVFLVGGLIIACFVAGFNIQRTPLFLIMVIILLFITSFVGMKIANFYEDFALDDTDLEFSTYFPKADFIMSNLALFIIGMVFVFGLGAIFRGNTSL